MDDDFYEPFEFHFQNVIIPLFTRNYKMSCLLFRHNIIITKMFKNNLEKPYE